MILVRRYVDDSYRLADPTEISKRVSAAQKVAMEAKCLKDRRDSRGFDAIRQHLHTRNAAKSYNGG